MKCSFGLGFDELELAKEWTEGGSELFELGQVGVSTASLAKPSAGLLELVLEWLGGLVGSTEDCKCLAALGIAEVKAVREVANAALGPGFVFSMIILAVAFPAVFVVVPRRLRSERKKQG